MAPGLKFIHKQCVAASELRFDTAAGGSCGFSERATSIVSRSESDGVGTCSIQSNRSSHRDGSEESRMRVDKTYLRLQSC